MREVQLLPDTTRRRSRQFFGSTITPRPRSTNGTSPSTTFVDSTWLAVLGRGHAWA
jgi:hypothetical protein